MNKSLTVAVIVSLGLALGCQRKNQTAELAEVPPPVEPVQIQPIEMQPVEPVQFVDPAAQAPASSTYTVQKNDTLWKIAERHYGSGQRWQDIAAANPGVNPKKLAVGQVLTLP
jgi:5'-nucleotidase / UDP-sugar diphosphatase